MKAIVYTSNTGFTERYAKLLGDKIGLAVYRIDEAKKSLSRGDEIIYFGWLMANSIKDYKKTVKIYNIRAVCGVGLCPTGELLDEARRASGIPADIPLFTLQGGLNKDRLKGINKFMINMLVKMLSSKKNKTAEDEAQLELIQKGGDYVDEKNLSAFLKWYEENK